MPTFRETLHAIEGKKPRKGSKGLTRQQAAAKAREALAAKAAIRIANRTKEEEQARKERKREINRVSVAKYQRANRPLSREIGLFEVQIDWNRRLRCKTSLQAFCETYLAPVFYHGWSSDQLVCLEKAQIVCHKGGKFCVAMPRGGGKTAIVRAATLWATLYGYKHFVYNVGSTEPKSTQTLNFIAVQLENNPLLKQDFPELCWPLVCLEGTNRLARGQLFNGEPTHVHLASDFVRYPTLQLPEEIAQAYRAGDPTSVRWLSRGGDTREHKELPRGMSGVGTKGGTADSSPAGPDSDGHPHKGSATGKAVGRKGALARAEAAAAEIVPSPKESEEASGFWISTNAGVILRCSGIDGSIRGEAEVDPVTLEQPRPDLVILDDVQKDAKADSPIMCDKLVRLIDGAVTGLAGGGQHIDVLMPCTVIREGDVADTFLDPLKKPDFQGERCAMVKSWPDGVTDFEITNDSPAGKLWNQYAELRRVSLRDCGSFDRATEFYRKNQGIMDAGFTVSWLHRYDKRSEISAQQHAFNLRLQSPQLFLPEYQNIGRRLIDAADTMITAEQLMKKVVDYKRGQVPPNCQQIICHVDVQDEVLFYLVFAFDYDFNGTFIDYGTWPDVNVPYFTKSQTASWSNITRLFFEAHPQHRAKAHRTSGGKIRAPLEAKIYWALGQLITYLKSKEYARQDMAKKRLNISYISIDTRWGQASEAIKRYLRESGHKELMPYYGQAFPPTQRQLEEYERREGWMFENMRNPNVKEPKWVLRPNPDGMWYMAADVNRLKDFLFGRLATPQGAQGSVSLHTAPSEYHELLAHHICSSEYPEPVSARGITKNQWTVREGSAYDNDYLDCAAGCMALAGFCGASLKTTEQTYHPVKRVLSQIRNQKALVVNKRQRV